MEVDDVDYNIWIKASLPRIIDGTNKRLGIYGASDEVKGIILRELGFNYDDLIANGLPIQTTDVLGGIQAGGSRLEFHQTRVEGVWVELVFDSTYCLETRDPFLVSLVRVLNGQTVISPFPSYS